MRIIMFGPPGSGKGTYSSRVSAKLGFPHVSIGDLCRAEAKKGTDLGIEIKRVMDEGGLQREDIITEMVKNRLVEDDVQSGIIFDGYPRTLFQAEELDKSGGADVVINLNVPDWILVKRLTARRTCRGCGEIFNVLFLKPKEEGKCDKCGGELYQRDDEVEEAVKERLKVYNELTKPLIAYYENKGLIRTVTNEDIDTPPEPIVERIMVVLQEFMK